MENNRRGVDESLVKPLEHLMACTSILHEEPKNKVAQRTNSNKTIPICRKSIARNPHYFTSSHKNPSSVHRQRRSNEQHDDSCYEMLETSSLSVRVGKADYVNKEVIPATKKDSGYQRTPSLVCCAIFIALSDVKNQL
ncbi:hypothetical protein DINM_001130 [Dirofilaria immitis]|nr:hypothetical protein [Dirofilaria immitis]